MVIPAADEGGEVGEIRPGMRDAFTSEDFVQGNDVLLTVVLHVADAGMREIT